MGTALYAITNSKLTGDETKIHWDNILKQLQQSDLSHSRHLDIENGQYVEDNDEWEYYLDEKTDESPFQVYYSTPHTIAPYFFKKIGIISTIYRYSMLYRFAEFGWDKAVRMNIFKLVQIMGGTEIIYLADNGSDKLSTYLELMALENIPYEEIKTKMITELGSPVTDYFDLDYSSLDYRNITEFFLDDFKDFKNEKFS